MAYFWVLLGGLLLSGLLVVVGRFRLAALPIQSAVTAGLVLYANQEPFRIHALIPVAEQMVFLAVAALLLWTPHALMAGVRLRLVRRLLLRFNLAKLLLAAVLASVAMLSTNLIPTSHVGTILKTYLPFPVDIVLPGVALLETLFFYSLLNPYIHPSADRRGSIQKSIRIISGTLGYGAIIVHVVFVQWWCVNSHVCYQSVPTLSGYPDSSLFGTLQEQALVAAGTLDTLNVPGSIAHAMQSKDGRGPYTAALLPFLTIAVVNTLVFFLTVLLPLWFFSVLLFDVQSDSKRYVQRFRNARTYRRKFFAAVLNQHPLLALTAVFLVVFLTIVPLFAHRLGHGATELLLGPDQFLIGFALLSAILSPMVISAMNPEETFARHFYEEVELVIVSMRRHSVFLGYFDLGSKALCDELRRQVDESAQWAPTPRSPGALIGHWLRKNLNRDFGNVVTPDLDVEWIASRVLVVEQAPGVLSFSSNSQLLGQFGVITVSRDDVRRPPVDRVEVGAEVDGDPRGQYHRADFLVPVVCGTATDPDVIGRVNLYHADFMVSTISETLEVQDVAGHAVEAAVPSVIAVDRASKMHELPPLVSASPILLIYPKQNTGIQLFCHLAPLWDRCISQENRYPKVLVIGADRSSYYAVEELVHSLLRSGFDSVAERISAAIFQAVIRDENRGMVPHREGWTDLFGDRWRIAFTRDLRSAFVTDPPYFVEIRVEYVDREVSGFVEKAMLVYGFDVVVVNDDRPQWTDALLTSCLAGLGRLPDSTRRPAIVFVPTKVGSAETEDASLRDRLGRYDADRGVQGWLYPSVVVSEHEDSLAMIKAFRRTCRRKQEARAEGGVSGAVRVACVANEPGALAALLANSAGLRVSSEAKRGWETPDLTFVRDLWLTDASGARAGFAVRAQGRLRPDIPSLGSQPVARLVSKSTSGGHQEGDSWDAWERWSDDRGATLDRAKVLESVRGTRVADRCPGMAGCLVAALTDQACRASKGDIKKSQDGFYLLQGRGLWTAKGLVVRASTSPSADIFVCCADAADRPGILAELLSAFAFRRPVAGDGPLGLEVWDTDFFRNHVCHNARFGLSMTIGQWVSDERMKFGADFEEKQWISAIQVRPAAPGSVNWLVWAVRLLEFLRSGFTLRLRCSKDDMVLVSSVDWNAGSIRYLKDSGIDERRIDDPPPWNVAEIVRTGTRGADVGCQRCGAEGGMRCRSLGLVRE